MAIGAGCPLLRYVKQARLLRVCLSIYIYISLCPSVCMSVYVSMCVWYTTVKLCFTWCIRKGAVKISKNFVKITNFIFHHLLEKQISDKTVTVFPSSQCSTVVRTVVRATQQVNGKWQFWGCQNSVTPEPID